MIFLFRERSAEESQEGNWRNVSLQDRSFANDVATLL